MKRKQAEAPDHPTSRIWIVAVVAGAIIIVLGLKFLGADTKAPPQAPVSPALATGIPEQEGTSQGSGTPAADEGQSDPAATLASPFPSEPLAQIDWVQRNNKPAMILFHSTNCIPCKQMEALVAKIRADFEPDVYFIDVITDDRANADLVRQAGIQVIPTTFLVNSEGKGVRTIGVMEEDVLRGQLDLLRQGGL